MSLVHQASYAGALEKELDDILNNIDKRMQQFKHHYSHLHAPSSSSPFGRRGVNGDESNDGVELFDREEDYPESRYDEQWMEDKQELFNYSMTTPFLDHSHITNYSQGRNIHHHVQRQQQQQQQHHQYHGTDSESDTSSSIGKSMLNHTKLGPEADTDRTYTSTRYHHTTRSVVKAPPPQNDDEVEEEEEERHERTTVVMALRDLRKADERSSGGGHTTPLLSSQTLKQQQQQRASGRVMNITSNKNSKSAMESFRNAVLSES
jgi:hypothetical protein